MSVFLQKVLIVVGLAGLLCAACGSRSSLEREGADTPDRPPVNCGDGTCGADESCATCAGDCGLCAGCGDGTCSAEETCKSCPGDCKVCEECGDGFCKGDETCSSCAPDCGKCESCGNGSCQAQVGEDCFSCPEDCGNCPSCGDGRCRASETCASCVIDCGVCAVCGNQKCEQPYETCSNCHEDCGDCEIIGCFSMLSCAFGCIDQATQPPTIHASCIGDCVAKGCPQARFLFDQAFNCFIQKFDDCGNNFSLQCLLKECDAPVAACLGARCE